jgi:hypothetical protein
MKKRNLAAVVILGLITFGLYDLYWLSSTRKEMIAKGYQVASLWRAIVYPFLGIIASIVALTIVESGSKNSPALNAIFILIVMGSFLAWFVLGVRFLSSYCHAVEKVTKNELTYSYSFWMGIVMYLFRVGFIWEAIIQNNFNKLEQTPVAESSSQPTQPAIATQPPSAAAEPINSNDLHPPQTPSV